MSGESRLNWGSLLFGVLVVGGALFYWNMTHPFNQTEPPLAEASGAAIEANEVFTGYVSPGSTPLVSNTTPSASANVAAPGTEPTVNADGTPAAPSQAFDIPVVINYTELAQDKQHWPRKVRLKADTLFPATIDGQAHGSVNAPAGAEVYLIKVNPEKTLLVGFGAAELTLPAEATNFEETLYQILRSRRAR